MNTLRTVAIPAFALLVLTATGSPVMAADAHVNLYLVNSEFRIGSATGTAAPTITVTAGDTIHFRVENRESDAHTFTVPHFNLERNLSGNGVVVFVNITTASADVGRWQFWCRFHAGGSDPNAYAGMIGFIQVNGRPQQPGFEAIAAIAGAGIAFAVFAVYRFRKRS